MKVWITKYALSSGIVQRTGNRSENTPSMFCVDGERRGEFFDGEGRDWHTTESAAITRAEAMRVAKIASLRKQIAKLEKLSFARAR